MVCGFEICVWGVWRGVQECGHSSPSFDDKSTQKHHDRHSLWKMWNTAKNCTVFLKREWFKDTRVSQWHFVDWPWRTKTSLKRDAQGPTCFPLHSYIFWNWPRANHEGWAGRIWPGRLPFENLWFKAWEIPFWLPYNPQVSLGPLWPHSWPKWKSMIPCMSPP